MQRVVVTGRGVISPIGRGVAAFASALSAGAVGIARLDGMPPGSLASLIGARVRDFDAATDGGTDDAHADRATQFALAAARQALAESGLDGGDGLRGTRAAAIVGTGCGCIETLDKSYATYTANKARRLHPLTVPRIMPNAPAAHISMACGITGPAFAVSSACASAAYAMTIGANMIRHGQADVVVVGGAEACFAEGNLKAWEALRVLAPDTCRPFSRDRRGLVLGEGAAMFVFESIAHAAARDAEIYGEITGCAFNSDAHHILSPSLDGQVAAIRACLHDAGVAHDEIGYINAHGTATAANDATESRAIRAVFGDEAGRLRVSSTKSMHGHALGASGALELLATLVGLQQGFAPPTMNYTEPDPDCDDLNYVPNEAQQLRCKSALSHSFAFGGHNAVLAVRAAAYV